MATKTTTTEKRLRLKKKIRAKVAGSASRPRLSVYRSNKFIYAQLIDDDKGVTIASASDMGLKKGTKAERAQEVRKMIATKGTEKKITKVIFDRNGSKYIGRIKTLADEERKNGLDF